MNVIEIEQITKDYGGRKGVFDVSFGVAEGEVMGFLGPNGAGKTTTIRQLMGFIKPDSGTVSVSGLDCFANASTIQQNLGYLPGEIAFMDDMTGTRFIRLIAAMKGLHDLSRAEKLQAFFELDAGGKIKKMSKGMKQKIGIVCAFMQDADILVLDEPTSGLDPLMQNKFIELVLYEKKRGKTILMSSHLFEEVEKTCDRAAIIRAGSIVTVQSIAALTAKRRKRVSVRFATVANASSFAANTNGAALKNETVTVPVTDMNAFLKALAPYQILDLTTHTQSLEELFMHFYEEAAQ
ncbi:MAG: ABC transporter ATP-binding protein [Ruthenibacterium sp.]